MMGFTELWIANAAGGGGTAKVRYDMLNNLNQRELRFSLEREFEYPRELEGNQIVAVEPANDKTIELRVNLPIQGGFAPKLFLRREPARDETGRRLPSAEDPVIFEVNDNRKPSDRGREGNPAVRAGLEKLRQDLENAGLPVKPEIASLAD